MIGKNAKGTYPRWADRLLRWYCKSELIEEIQGDLHEIFAQRVEKQGMRTARRRFIWDVLRSCRSSTVKRPRVDLPVPLFRNQLKLSFRNLWSQKYFSIVNMAGLTLGLTSCIAISIYLRHETSYDMHHYQGENLYRLVSEDHRRAQVFRSIYHNPPLADVILKNIPEVDDVCRLRGSRPRLVRAKGMAKSNYEKHILFADPELLSIFTMPLKFGSNNSALSRPSTIVITEEKASQYFGAIDPIGKLLYFDNDLNQPYEVTGVIQSLNYPSHLQYDFYVSMEGLEQSRSGNWAISSYPTYLRLREGANASQVEGKVLDLAYRFKEDLAEEQANGVGRTAIQYRLQPVRDIYLHSAGIMAFGNWPTGDARHIWLFTSIALLVLPLAIINFVNLSTARSAARAREVGVRKVLGSKRWQLTGHFLWDSILQSVVAAIMAIGIVWVLCQYFSLDIPGTTMLPWETWWQIPLLLLLSLVVGIVAGLYPALVLSSFSPVSALRNGWNSKGHTGLRNGLIVFQFATSVALIFGTVLIYRQMKFIESKELGFDRERVIIIEDTYTLGQQVVAFRSALKQLPAVSHATTSSFLPVEGYVLGASTFQHQDSAAGTKEVELQRWFVDDEYISTFGMNLIEGRSFRMESAFDTNAVILNETAVEILGLADPIGKQVIIDIPYHIIGIVKDFHFQSLRSDITGLALHRGLPQFARSTIVRTHTDKYTSVIENLRDTWERFAPDQAMRYHFLDDRFLRMYDSERRTGLLFAAFAGLTIFVACLGSIALISFTAEQRRKELSIRKILGASIANLAGLQARRFVYLLALAILIGIPTGYFIMKDWLSDFSFRIEISWYLFALPVMVGLGIISGIVFYQGLKIALLNPVQALRER